MMLKQSQTCTSSTFAHLNHCFLFLCIAKYSFDPYHLLISWKWPPLKTHVAPLSIIFEMHLVHLWTVSLLCSLHLPCNLAIPDLYLLSSCYGRPLRPCWTICTARTRDSEICMEGYPDIQVFVCLFFGIAENADVPLFVMRSRPNRPLVDCSAQQTTLTYVFFVKPENKDLRCFIWHNKPSWSLIVCLAHPRPHVACLAKIRTACQFWTCTRTCTCTIASYLNMLLNLNPLAFTST